MPTIQLTNNTGLNLVASAADRFASLNRYLANPLSLIAPAGLTAIAGTTVGDADPTAFPVSLSVGGEGKFAVEATSLDVQPGAAASVGLLTGADAVDFFGALQWPADPASASLVSFGLQGTLSAGDSATVSGFSFGITQAATVSVTSFCTAAAGEKLADALGRAVAALTIPHDLDDLTSLPPGAICQIDAAGSLKFAASVTYNVINNPLATTAIPNLPSIAVNATAAATIDATATHTSDHTVTIARLPGGLLHLSVNFKGTGDFTTSLTVSAGATAKIGNQDALAFLLNLISPNSTTEFKKIQAGMPAAQAHQLGGDIKAAIDASLSSSLQASLKATLDASHSNSRVFLFEIDLAAAALDPDSTAALQSALKGDFTAMTMPRAALAGIRELDSALTVTSAIKHSLALHLLGIFNWSTTNAFVQKSKAGYTKDTHEIVLSDETIEIATNNLSAEKLREVVVKGITLTLPASANTPAATSPLNMVFFDREGGASPSKMRQFVNVLQATGAANGDHGTSSLYLGLNLTPPQCRQLFLDAAGHGYAWTTYLRYACEAAATILDGDEDNADRLKLYLAGEDFWQQLRDAGAASNQVRLLAAQGIRPNASVDVTTVTWWSAAMEKYAQALAANKPLVAVGKEVVKDSTRGFNEPWLILAVWNMLHRPPIVCRAGW